MSSVTAKEAAALLRRKFLLALRGRFHIRLTPRLGLMRWLGNRLRSGLGTAALGTGRFRRL